MKAILEFNLPEDNHEFNVAVKANNFKYSCWELDQWLRLQYKYMSDEEYNEDKYDTYIEVREKLREIMIHNGVNLEDA